MKPNIVFIFSDQQRWDTVSCYGQPLGSSLSLTPNLDALAAEGTRFDAAMTCQPVCGPARACIQTGRYPSEIGCQVNDRMLPLNQETIARLLNNNGYETAYVGKWHLASHNSFNKGPDTVDHKITAIPEEYRGGYKDFWVAADVLEFTSDGYHGYMFDGDGRKREFNKYRVDATTDFALEYLQKPKNQPFFLFISYVEPHYQNNHGHHEGPCGSKEKYSGFNVPDDLNGLDGDWKEEMPDYLGCCSSLDSNVGRIIEELKEQGIYDDTVIMYTSDHGSHFRTRNEEYKRSCHDSSIHVPFIAKGPGFDGGNAVSSLSSLIDIAPTILNAAGIEKPEYMSGEPMQKLVSGDVTHEEVFIQISESETARALRTPEYTYCVKAPDSVPYGAAGSDIYYESYLYDNVRDPAQHCNLVADSDYADLRTEFAEKLKAYIKKEENLQVEIYPALQK